MDFYNSKFSDSVNTFHVFERSNGEYYSIHGRDTDIALKTSIKSSIIVKTMKPDELPVMKYASFNKSIFEKLIKEILIVIGYKVEVYTNKRGAKEEWMLEYKGSPGNLSQFEDLLFNSAEPDILSNLLLSVQLVSSQQQKVCTMCNSLS
jgi:DNA mismatch repair protein MSH2